MRRAEGLTRPPLVRDRARIEFELDGADVVVTHLTVHGASLTERVPRTHDRAGLAARLSIGLHLSHEVALDVADEVRRRIGA